MGKKFDRLTVIEDAGGKLWRCRCDCGGSKLVMTVALNKGTTRSCGCIRKEQLTKRNSKHMFSGTPTHRTWKDMRARCNTRSNTDYANYGGRGIAVCGQWSNFIVFLRDMGERPDGKTIDRIDVNGNYTPENCRWADADTQANNKRQTRLIEINGVKASLAQWSRIYGVYAKTVAYRLRIGMSLENAFSKQDFRK